TPFIGFQKITLVKSARDLQTLTMMPPSQLEEWLREKSLLRENSSNSCHARELQAQTSYFRERGICCSFLAYQNEVMFVVEINGKAHPLSSLNMEHDAICAR
ncbi:hypothetical protein STEG23_021876, partial [Scotinomys teguina]